MAYTLIRNILGESYYSLDTPIVVIATLGTTMMGASDDILQIRYVLLDIGVDKNKLYIADAALN